MIYEKTTWTSDDPNDPVELWSELDDERWERRKVDVFRDGRMQAADADFETDDTFLGLIAVPDIDETNAVDAFHAVAVTREEFEAVWRRAMGQRTVV